MSRVITRVGLSSCNAEKLEALLEGLSHQTGAVECPPKNTSPVSQTTQRPSITPGQVRKIIADYQAGESTGQIAKKLGRSRNAISGVLKRHGVQLRSYSPDKVDIAQMVNYYRQGHSLAAIAKWFSISPTTTALHIKRNGQELRPRPGRGA